MKASPTNAMNQRHTDDHEPVRGQECHRTGSSYCPSPLVVGVTGGVATGKTTVARMLEDLGAKRISADEIVHELLRPGMETSRLVLDEFGSGILADGEIDRGKLGEIVFEDAEKRRRLEEIIHPPVMAEIAKLIDEFRCNCSGVLVVEIPLLVEVGATGMVDKVLLASAEQDTQIDRLQKRYNLSRRDALLRVQSQLPMAEKALHADWIISTEGTLRTTKRRVERLWSDVQKSLALRC